MSRALYAGSFDPLTNGHLSVLRGAVLLADTLIVAIGVHGSKQPLFNFKERKKIIIEAAHDALGKDAKKIEVISFDNLLVETAQAVKADFLIRGLRNATDFDYEMQLASMNKKMASKLQTVFLPADDEHRSISSSLVRQIASLGGDVSSFVPKNVVRALEMKFPKA